MTSDTRQRILDAAAPLIHRQGFNHTSIQEILQAAGVPKGSFYFYFKSKEDLGLALIDQFGQFWRQKCEEILTDPGRPPLQWLKDFFAGFQEYFRQNGCSGGCPVGNLAQEMGDVNPAFAQKLSQAIDFMAGRVADVLELARQAGQLAPESDSQALAYFIIASWQGALIRMKAVKNIEPLETFQRVVFDNLLVR